MKEETLQKVRDMGFPFMDVDEVRIPTLSDILSTCDYDFRSLSYHSKRTAESTYQRWIAQGGKKKFGKWVLRNGDSPDEAVAKLWLALQENLINNE